MKKMLAAALALVMMLAVMVPAFAADKTIALKDGVTSGSPAEVIIKTSTDKLGDDDQPVDARTYTVSIPADQVIPWGGATADDPYEMTYQVTSQLAYNEFVKVSVAGNGEMVYAPEAGVELKLAYTLGGATEFTAASPVLQAGDAAATQTLNVVVADWSAAIIGEYADTLTFTAGIVDETGAAVA